MAIPSRDVRAGDTYTVELDTWVTDYVIYKSIGSSVSVLSNRQERKWWCLWLCKRPVPMRAEIIDIANEYFLAPGPVAAGGGPIVVPGAAQNGEWRNTDSQELKHRYFGWGVDNALPYVGVLSVASVRVRGQIYRLEAGAGRIP